MNEALLEKQATGLPLANPLCHLLDKPREDFTREDLLRIVEQCRVERITFHYTALDGKYKELRLPVSSIQRAERILAEGERVDGSSLFRGMVESTISDLYVVPLFKSAFLNPFDDKSLDFTCRYVNRDGELAAFAPDSVLARASSLLTRNTGLELRALGELEYFLIGKPPTELFPAPPQRGYHSSTPFLKFGDVLAETLRSVAQVTGAVKYAHSEVGSIRSIDSEVEEIRGKTAEQVEIEFLPSPVAECGDILALARWIIRTVACRHDCVATFTPKLAERTAGNGLHVHMELARGGKNIMLDGSGELSPEAKRLVGGLCHYARSLTAFGNTMASSYLRLVPNYEAPVRVCWSDMNRNALIRIPLAWSKQHDLAAALNPQQKTLFRAPDQCQTVELRSPDGSAAVHLLLAGITMAAEWGLTHPESLELAERFYASAEMFRDDKRLAELPALPASCAESRDILIESRALYERDGIFPPPVIEYVARILHAEDDRALGQIVAGLDAEQREREPRRIMHRDLHRH
jgi:glutamine synthetase